MSLTTNNNFKIRAWQLADDVGDGHDMVQCDVRSVLAVHFEVVYYNKYHFLVEIPCSDLQMAQSIVYAMSTAYDQGRESMKEDYRNLMGIKQ